VRDSDSQRLTEFDQYRGLLFSIAYRMVGSVADAEDLLQETFIRWLKASNDDIRSAKAFLITIITRLCINYLQSARVRRKEYIGQWLPEPLIAPAAEADDSLSIAFLVLLERLNPTERAVFLLREVFDYDYADNRRGPRTNRGELPADSATAPAMTAQTIGAASGTRRAMRLNIIEALRGE